MGPTDGGGGRGSSGVQGTGEAGHTWKPGLALEKDPDELE